MGHGNDCYGVKTLTFVDILPCFLIFLPSICFMSSATHSSLGSVHTIRPFFMVKLWGNGENRCIFSLRPCEILNHFSVDMDGVFARAYLHYSGKIAASIQLLQPVVYGILLNPGLHFFHIFQTAVVIRHWKVRNLRINVGTPQFEHIFALCSKICVNTMIK